MILEAPSLKDGTGCEIRRLHDTVQQHLQALKSMGCEPSGPFITSILELKLDVNTSFEWQKFSQYLPNFPHYGKLLEFLNLWAQASEASTTDMKKHLPRVDNHPRKGVSKQITSFTADLSPFNCTLCKTEKHSVIHYSYRLSLAGLYQRDQCESCHCAPSDMQSTKSAHSVQGWMEPPGRSHTCRSGLLSTGKDRPSTRCGCIFPSSLSGPAVWGPWLTLSIRDRFWMGVCWRA